MHKDIFKFSAQILFGSHGLGARCCVADLKVPGSSPGWGNFLFCFFNSTLLIFCTQKLCFDCKHSFHLFTTFFPTFLQFFKLYFNTFSSFFQFLFNFFQTFFQLFPNFFTTFFQLFPNFFKLFPNLFKTFFPLSKRLF